METNPKKAAFLRETVRETGADCRVLSASIDDVAEGDLLDQFDREVSPYVQASAAGRDEYDGRFTRRTGALMTSRRC